MVAIIVAPTPHFRRVFVSHQPHTHMVAVIIAVTEPRLHEVSFITSVVVAGGTLQHTAHIAHHPVASLPPAHTPFVAIRLYLEHRHHHTSRNAVKAWHKSQLFERQQLPMQHYIVAKRTVAEGCHERHVAHSSRIVDVQRIVHQLIYPVDSSTHLFLRHPVLEPLLYCILHLPSRDHRHQHAQYYEPPSQNHSVTVVCGVRPSTLCVSALKSILSQR